MRTSFKMLCLVVSVLLFGLFGFANADVTIAPANPDVGNCYPFGGTDNSPGWTPYAGFVYQNVPAFNIVPGDILAFDLGATNDVNIQLEISMAPTTVNGGSVQSGSFVQVVSNTQTPANPTGDNTVGNFELQFTAEAPFSFPGGGLIIRFSNPGGAYAGDTSCTQVLVNASSSDPSGYFVQRIFNDVNGVSPWDSGDPDSIGGFQVLNVAAIPTMNEWGMMIFAILAGIGAVYYLRKRYSA
jgi:hypothetical protein